MGYKIWCEDLTERIMVLTIADIYGFRWVGGAAPTEWSMNGDDPVGLIFHDDKTVSFEPNLKFFKTFCHYEWISPDKCLDCASSELAPNRPIHPRMCKDGYSEGRIIWDVYCPICSYDFGDKHMNFCPRCGQVIDWNKENIK